MRLAWAWLAVALAGCEVDPDAPGIGVCSAVCRCTAMLPGLQHVCVDDCLRGTALRASSACEACVFETSSSCPSLVEQCLPDDGPCAPGPDPDPFPPGRLDEGR